MDYNLYQRVNPTEISYNLDVALPYGEMPNEALIKKFEETAYFNDSEGVYEEYARTTLRDQSPDTAHLEQNLPRRNYDSAGAINTRYYGGRGQENSPAHPEIFLGLTEKEPRGIATDPDMRKMVEQQEARMRFKRFSADADNSVHHGRWSESEAFHKSRYLLQKAVQPRLKIFRQSLDGRREGLRRDYYPHVSSVNKVEEDVTRFRPEGQEFIDYITDYALNPQRRVTKISNKLIRNTRMYHQFTTDHEFKVASYGDNPRKQRMGGLTSRVNDTDIGDLDNRENMSGERVENEDTSKSFKSAGLLMGAIVAQKHQDADQTGGTTEEGHNLQTQAARKTMALQKNLDKLLYEIKSEAVFGTSDPTKFGKNPKPQRAAHLALTQDAQHIAPSHHLMNAEIIYKGLQPGADMEAIKYEIITDDRKPVRREELSLFGKSARTDIVTGKRESVMEVNGKQMNTQTYKSGNKRVNGASVDMFHGEDFAKYQDDNQVRRPGINKHREVNIGDVRVATEQFSNNESKERRLAPMGKDKFAISRHTERDYEVNVLNG